MQPRAVRRVRARAAWDRLGVSFWFAPLVMGIAAVLLAWLMVWLDGQIANRILQNSRLVLTGETPDMRPVLIGISTSVLATAGVVFTLLTLPLSTVAAQYGSRLLRVFLGDRTTQLVLGTFVATFIYCIAAALAIPPISVDPEPPQITVTVGLLLALGTFASLILLIQHISTMLQAPNIAASAGAALMAVVRAELADIISSGATGILAVQGSPEPAPEGEGYPIYVECSGYLQYIDPQYLIVLAREHDLSVRLLNTPGQFIRIDKAVALVCPAGRVDRRLEEQLRRSFQVGNNRTPTQDVVYAVNQLVEMAVRAMSPAINDPFTAMTCLDYIGEGLALFARQGERSTHYYDGDGKLRLVLDPVCFDDLLEAAFDMLRHCSSDNASVLLHMLAVIDLVGTQAQSPQARLSLARHARLVQDERLSGSLVERDRQAIQASAEAIIHRLDNPVHESGGSSIDDEET